MLTRRDFLRQCRTLSLLLGGNLLLTRGIAEGFIRLAGERPRVAFVQGQNCFGCTTSLAYGNESDFSDFITRIVRLQVHPGFSIVQSEDYLRALERLVAEGDFILVVEGGIPVQIPQACYLGEQPLAQALHPIATKARLVVAVGSCASHGGIPASGKNETGALPVEAYLLRHKIRTPLIKLPGCPVHPDHLVGTLAYVAATGKIPPLKEGRPESYFGEQIHRRCGRYQYFTQDHFVVDFATEWHACLLKQGCRGPLTFSDCPVRRWNDGTSVCMDGNTPCIGCMAATWPSLEPLYRDAAQVEDVSWRAMKERTREEE